MPRNLKDATYVKTWALPAAASNSTNSAILDIGADGYKPESIEALISIPALDATMAPDTRTFTLIIDSSTSSSIASVTQNLVTKVFTGAGGVGIAASEVRVRLPSNCPRYLRATVTSGASTGNASTVSATFALTF